MPAAQNSRRQYAYQAETTFGVTPGVVDMKLIEVVDFGLEMKSTQLTDPSIRSDRQTAFARRGNLSVEGPLQVVMCPTNYDVFLEALLGGTWATNKLMVGTTARSFLFEEGFMDLAQYRVFNGVVFNTMSLDISTDKLVEANFGLMGASATALTGASIDSTPTAITSQAKFFHESGTIKVGGTTLAYVTAVKIDVSNNFKGDYALTSTAYRALTPGKVSVECDVTALFEDATLYNAFKNNTASSLEVTLVDGGGKSHTYKMANLRWTEGSMNRSADGPVFVNLKGTAIYDATDSMFAITRV